MAGFPIAKGQTGSVIEDILQRSVAEAGDLSLVVFCDSHLLRKSGSPDYNVRFDIAPASRSLVSGTPVHFSLSLETSIELAKALLRHAANEGFRDEATFFTENF